MTSTAQGAAAQSPASATSDSSLSIQGLFFHSQCIRTHGLTDVMQHVISTVVTIGDT